jgi:hypothetical protein
MGLAGLAGFSSASANVELDLHDWSPPFFFRVFGKRNELAGLGGASANVDLDLHD